MQIYLYVDFFLQDSIVRVFLLPYGFLHNIIFSLAYCKNVVYKASGTKYVLTVYAIGKAPGQQ